MDEMLAMIDKILHDEEAAYYQRIAVLRVERERIIRTMAEKKMLEPPPPVIIKAQ